MNTMGVRRRVTTWRAKADLVEGLARHMPANTKREAVGYVEAMRECAAQLEATLNYRATRRPGSER